MVWEPSCTASQHAWLLCHQHPHLYCIYTLTAELRAAPTTPPARSPRSTFTAGVTQDAAADLKHSYIFFSVITICWSLKKKETLHNQDNSLELRF